MNPGTQARSLEKAAGSLSWKLNPRFGPYHGYLAHERSPKLGAKDQVAGATRVAEATEGSSNRERRIQQQETILDAHPLEYVVMVGDRVFALASDEKEALSHWDAAWDAAGEDEDVVVIPPAAVRAKFKPIVGGRTLASPPPERPK